MLKINVLFDPIAQHYRQHHFDAIGDDEGQHTKAKSAQKAVSYVLYAINRNKPQRPDQVAYYLSQYENDPAKRFPLGKERLQQGINDPAEQESYDISACRSYQMSDAAAIPGKNRKSCQTHEQVKTDRCRPAFSAQ